MSADEQTSAAHQAKETAGRMTDQVRAQSADVMQKAQETATNTVSQQKGRAAESVGTLADALRQTGQHLEQNDQGGFSRVVNQAADRLEEFSNDLQSKSVDEIVNDVENFARRDPGLFLGGAFLAGLLGARFFRSSARRQSYDRGRYDMTSSRYYGSSGATGYSRQGRGQFSSETTQEDYTGTYMPDYYGSGSTTESKFNTRQPSPQPPSVRPYDYPPASDMGDRPFTDPTHRTDE